MKRLKHAVITAISVFTGNSVVNIFGKTYLVAGNFILRIR